MTVLYNFDQFVSHASQGYLTKRNLARVTSHKAIWCKGSVTWDLDKVIFTKPLPKWPDRGGTGRNFAHVTGFQTKWRTWNFVRCVTVTERWWIDWNCTVISVMKTTPQVKTLSKCHRRGMSQLGGPDYSDGERQKLPICLVTDISKKREVLI